jgi:hypothetical protein
LELKGQSLSLSTLISSILTIHVLCRSYLLADILLEDLVLEVTLQLDDGALRLEER